jgi:hypothetical protein
MLANAQQNTSFRLAPPILSFFVPGIPRTRGSKRAFLYKRRSDGKQCAALADDSGEAGDAWFTLVRDLALLAWGDNRAPLTQVIALVLVFERMRPKAHFRTGTHAGVLRPDAPPWPLGKPDLFKTTRAVEDAMSSVVYRDDSQICMEVVTKRYSSRWGVEVKVFAQPEEALRFIPEAQTMLDFGPSA